MFYCLSKVFINSVEKKVGTLIVKTVAADNLIYLLLFFNQDI